MAADTRLRAGAVVLKQVTRIVSATGGSGALSRRDEGIAARRRVQGTASEPVDHREETLETQIVPPDLFARHACPVCPAGVNVAKTVGNKMKACCPKRKTVVKTRTRIVTKTKTKTVVKQTLSGRIFIDTNLNGRYDAGVDIPRGNWPVIIVLVNSTKARLAARAPPGLTKLAETTTNSDGTWTATYTSPPPGSVLGITDDSTLQSDVMDKITVPAGGQVPGNTFGSSPTNASCSGAADCPAATGGCSTPACNSGICSYTFTSCSVTPSSTVGGGVTTKKVVSSSVAPALPSSTVVAALTTKFTTAVPLVPSSTADSKSSTRLPTTTISIAASTTAEAMVSTTQQLAAGTTSDTATTTALESSTSQTATATPTPTTSSLSQTTSSATETTSTPAPCPWNFDSTVPAGYIINIAGANTFGAGGQATSVLLESPRGIAVDSQNNTFVADRDRIWKIYPNGSTVVYAGVINIGYISRYGGDGGPATSAKLSAPTGLAFTPDGDLLVADSGNNRIRIIYQSNGTIDTVAGNGGSDGDGDDGPAVNATIARPLGVAMTSAGVMYIAAANNYAVRKVSAAGIITTFAGQNGNSGADSGDNGAATDATFDTPAGVAVDSSGRVFISDMYGTSVRMVATNGIISSPSSQPSWSYLSLLSTDNTGKILIADQGIQQVYRFTPPNSGFTLVAGDGGSGFVDNCDAVNAQLKNPSNAVTDSVGQIYITDSGNRRIRKIDTSGTISTFAGTGFSYYAGDGGPATSAEVGTQQAGITMHSATKELYFADTQANTIRKIAVDGIISTVVGTTDYAFAGDSGPATSASLKGPYDVVFGPDGRMFIADTSNARIRAVSTGGTISTFAGNGAYAYSGDGGPATSASFKYPIALAIDSAGNLFVAEQLGNVIRKIDTNGIISTAAGNGTSGKGPMGVQANRTMFQSPGGVEVNPAGTMLYFTDKINSAIKVVNLTSGIIDHLAGSTTGSTGFIDGAATSARFKSPSRLRLSPDGNSLFVADSSNFAIRKIDLVSLVVSTVAGNQTEGDFATGAWPATSVSLAGPLGIHVDGNSTIYFTDTGAYNRIRAVRGGGC